MRLDCSDDVTVAPNLSVNDFQKVMRDFRAKAEGAEIAIDVGTLSPMLARPGDPGNGVALANIAGRIAYHFQDRGALVIDEAPEAYVCTLRLPHD